MSGSNSVGTFFDRAATVLLVVAALTLSIVAITDRLQGEPKPPSRVSVEEQWQSYIDTARLAAGNQTRVVVNVFSDYQCRFCKTLDDQLESARAALGDDVEVQFRHFPLPRHAAAKPAAIAAVCAAEMGAGPEMHRVLFRHQDSLGSLEWDELARRSGVTDIARFASCLSADATAAQVDADIAAGQRLAISGTPTFLVNQYRVTGVMTREELLDLVAKARSDAGRDR